MYLNFTLNVQNCSAVLSAAENKVPCQWPSQCKRINKPFAFIKKNWFHHFISIRSAIFNECFVDLFLAQYVSLFLFFHRRHHCVMIIITDSTEDRQWQCLLLLLAKPPIWIGILVQFECLKIMVMPTNKLSAFNHSA